MASPFRLALLQLAPRLRDPVTNLRRILEGAAAAEADLVLTPELSLTGYDLRDDAASLAVPLAPGETLRLGPREGGPDEQSAQLDARELPGHLVLGLVERGPGGLPFNAMVALREGRVAFVHRKIYLPTYGMFEEGRWFGRGERVEPFPLGRGWRAGFLVCEDLWHPALPYLYATLGVNVLLVQAAAPGRGAWEGGEAGRFASWDTWIRIVRTTAELLGVYVALCNRNGVEGGITFAGGSLVVGPDGEVLARAAHGEATLTAELRLEEVARSRRPYSHARDEDPRLVLRILRRVVEGG